MIYVIAWLVIGFTCAVLTNSYYTTEVYERIMQKTISRKGIKKEDVPEELTYETFKVFSFVLCTLYGPLGLAYFYNTRREYRKLQNKKK